MRVDRRGGAGARSRAAAAIALSVAASGCMTYRGPRGIEAAVERRMGVDLHRELGFRLGPLSTKFAASFVYRDDGDEDFRDLTRIAVAVFEVTGRTGAAPQPLTAGDLGVKGWKTLIETRGDGEQLLVLAKPGGEGIRKVMFFSSDGDEVVIASLEGHLERLIDKMLAAEERDGARGARAAIGAGPD